MGDGYGLPDLRHFMAGTTQYFPAIPQPTEPFTVHRNLTPPQHYEAIMVGPQRGDDQVLREHHSTSAAALCGLDMDGGCTTGGDGGNGRWPRQETLTLLEVRSRLDPKFKEANHKGPLWDEVSRIMAEEHGYQRSGKKCREKFENLYKYYKKTKEGKAGRQDGKHYRFFRQLEALYGETSNNQASVSETHLVRSTLLYQTANNNAINLANHEALQDHKICESLSLSNSSEFETSSSENNNEDDLSAIAFMMDHHSMEKKKMNESQSFKRVRTSWKAKIRDFVESNMKKLIETQDAWMEKMLKTIERKEQERLSREEEWRKLEVARIDREFKFWANERAWVEARDAALVEVLKKFTGKELKVLSTTELMAEEDDVNVDSNRWPEPEISSLIQLRTSMELRFQESGNLKEGLWEEVSAKMACLGYDRSAVKCKEKWENISIYINKTMEGTKRRKENLRITTACFQQFDSDHHGHEIVERRPEIAGRSHAGLSPSNCNADSAVQDSCLHVLMDGGHLWENYGVEFTKGKNQQA